MSKSKITPLVAIRSIPNEGIDGWWLNSQPNRAMRGFTNNIGWVNGGDENADIAAFIVKAVNAHEELEAFRMAVIGWRECDWPEGFDRRTAQLIADKAEERALALAKGGE